MPLNNREIWDRVTDLSKLEKLDRVRVELLNSDLDYGVTKVEGTINATGDDRFWVGDEGTVEMVFAFSQQPTVDRRRPQVNLPTKSGSAVLIYDTMFLEETVVGLVYNPVNGELEWRRIKRASVAVPPDEVERNYVRTLHDAGEA